MSLVQTKVILDDHVILAFGFESLFEPYYMILAQNFASRHSILLAILFWCLEITLRCFKLSVHELYLLEPRFRSPA